MSTASVAPPPARTEASSRALHHAAALVAGAVVLAAVHAVAVAVWVPLPTAGAGLRLQHHLFDAAETLGVGALAGALVGAFVRFSRAPRWAGVLAAALATGPLVHLAIGDQLLQLADLTRHGRHEAPLHAAYAVLASFVLPIVYLVGQAAGRRPRLRVAAVAVAVAALFGGQAFLRDDYFGSHGVLAWGAATFAGAALGPVAERAARALLGRRAVLGALGAAAALGIAVPPSNAVRFELFRQPAAVASWVLGAVLWRAPAPRGAASKEVGPWLGDRSALPAVPPTTPRLLPEAPVVVLISIDATRFDAVSDPAHDPALPTLARMKRTGVVFEHATAPSSKTSVSLSALFSGRYASQLRWSHYGWGPSRYAFPSRDRSPRVPRLLSEHGVSTAHSASIVFLGEAFGVARGFDQVTMVSSTFKHARAAAVLDPLIAQIERAGPGPRFLYAHLTEPHEPYDRGGTRGTEAERYLAEIAVADLHLARVVRALERLGDRWVLVVTADHGEAFGEHETRQHGKTLYEELVHVPLLVMGPRLAPRVVAQRVGLVDLGPTLLDLFGVPTPATLMGQSLVPLLAGSEAVLTRPLISECRLRRALTTNEGLKVIDDPRRALVEVYDLARDPGETENLFDQHEARSEAALATLRAFVAAQSRGGVYRQTGEL